jgi:colanic acid/amylovoran biosynthesis glycosyltransferase
MTETLPLVIHTIGSLKTRKIMPDRKIAYMLGTFPELAQTYIARELNGLLERGFDLYIFAVRRADTLGTASSLCGPALISRCTYARPDSILRHLVANIRAAVVHPVRYLSTLKLFVRDLHRMEPSVAARTLYHFFCGIGFARVLQELAITHIHAHFSTGSSLALAVSSYTGIPFSFTAHASGDIFMKPVLLETKLSRCRFAVPVSQYSARYLDSVSGRKYSEKLHWIYNGVHASECESISSSALQRAGRRKLTNPYLRIVSVGSLVGAKGHGTLVESCRVLKQQGMQFSCRIIGEGPERSNLTRLIDKWNLGKQVTITGYLSLDSVYAELAIADVFVLLSEIHINGYRDGLPTALIEAMLMSLPVISTCISAIPEIVINGVSGFLVPERDAIEAAHAIDRLARNADLRRQLGVAGRQRVLEQFNSERNLTQLFKLFTTAIDFEQREVVGIAREYEAQLNVTRQTPA